MTVDKFGRCILSELNKSSRTIPITFGFNVTKNGDVDIQNKRIM